MFRLFLDLVQILIGVYWAGEVARQNPKIDSFVAQLEGKYGEFNQRLKDVKIKDGLAVLRVLYGWLALAVFLLLLIFRKIISLESSVQFFILVIFFVSLFGWVSIKWCTEHKKAVIGFLPQFGLIVFGPLLMGGLDYWLGIPFNQEILDTLHEFPNLYGWEFPRSENPLVAGSIISVIMAILLSIYYVGAWFFSVPVVFVSVLFVFLPVTFARFVHVLAPRKAFCGFTILLFAVVTLWQRWL